jgi:glycosyltransferase involved in cell wall biosynthesis
MRIVHVVQRFHPEIGGAETHVRALAREQARRGDEVTVATSGATGGEAMEGYRVERFPVARRFRGDYLFPPWLPLRGLEGFLAASGADVLHAHGYRFATIEAAAAASRRARIPLVVTAHGFYPPESPLVALARWRYDRARGRAALARAARCVAVTGHEVAHYGALGVPADRVEVVPNGVDEAAFVPGDGKSFRATHGLGEGPLVVFLARLAHDKGLLDLVRAARGLEATVAVCGRDAGARRQAERAAPRNVRFLGPVDDPRDAYAAAQAFALPSHYEAFGLVLLEAMAQGRAVVATSAGGMPEVVGDAGVVVPPRSPEALRAALAGLLADESRRVRLGEAARARARSFLWSRVVDALEGTYRRAIADPR